MPRRAGLLVACFVSLGLMSGCGATEGPSLPKDVKKTSPVTGEITIDGAPAAGVNVYLILPENVAKAASELDNNGMIDKTFGTGHGGTTDGAGKFSISTYLVNDGAPAGEYVVAYFWQPRTVDGKRPDKKVVAAFNQKYGNLRKAKDKVKVEEGKPTDMGKIELTTKK